MMDETEDRPEQEFVLAEELARVWLQNPLKSVALEIMGMTILGCLRKLRPEVFENLLAAAPGGNYWLETRPLGVQIPLEAMLLDRTWCAENDRTMAMLDELAAGIPRNAVEGSVALMLEIFREPTGVASVKFHLMYIRRTTT